MAAPIETDAGSLFARLKKQFRAEFKTCTWPAFQGSGSMSDIAYSFNGEWPDWADQTGWFDSRTTTAIARSDDADAFAGFKKYTLQEPIPITLKLTLDERIDAAYALYRKLCAERRVLKEAQKPKKRLYGKPLRERILVLLNEGRSLPEIAADVGYVISTVTTHARQIADRIAWEAPEVARLLAEYNGDRELDRANYLEAFEAKRVEILTSWNLANLVR